jgi:hypothetical protein
MLQHEYEVLGEPLRGPVQERFYLTFLAADRSSLPFLHCGLSRHILALLRYSTTLHFVSLARNRFICQKAKKTVGRDNNMDTTQHTHTGHTHTEHVHTRSTPAQNQEAADEFYRRLDAAPPSRIAAIVREATHSAELDIIVRDSTQWRNARSRIDAQRRAAAAGRKTEERERARYARTQRRHYVTAMTRSQLPPPRLGPTLTPEEKQNIRRGYWGFAQKMHNPSDRYARKVVQEANSNYPLWALMHPTGGHVSAEEINTFRAQYLHRSPIMPGRIKRNEIRPAGISLERAMNIAAAALNRKDL